VPFINDQFGHNSDQLARQTYAQSAARISRFKFLPEQVIATLRARIVGQRDVMNAIEDMLFTLKADFGDKTRPLSVMLLMGPTGVGKTETVRVLAEAMLGSADELCRIDMNTLAQEHYSAALTGSPPGYVGSKEGQTLFDIERIKGSFSEPGIVLFDEIEKADKSVVRSLMNILDTGKLTLTSGTREIDFSNTLVFLTSNLGAREQADSLKSYSQGWRSALRLKPPPQSEILDQALNTYFDPEFINRIDRILPFNWLDDGQLEALVDLELMKLNKRLSSRQAQVVVSEGAREYLSQHYDTRYGARDIARRIRVELEPKLAKAMIEAPEKKEFEVTLQSNALVV